jgi:hypothetical protein
MGILVAALRPLTGLPQRPRAIRALERVTRACEAWPAPRRRQLSPPR